MVTIVRVFGLVRLRRS